MVDNTVRFHRWRTFLLSLWGLAAIVAIYWAILPADDKPFSTCLLAAQSDDQAKPADRTAPVDQTDPVLPISGFFQKSFMDEDGTPHAYMVYIPHAMKDSDRLPLVVYLNGDGENGTDAIRPLRNGLALAIWEQQHSFPFVVVWPVCDRGDNWSSGGRSTVRAIAIMRQVAEKFHTDPDRVYLTGISSGGGGTWALGSEYSDLFAAIVPVSGGGASDTDAVRIAAANLPVWSYYVDIDPGMAESNRITHQKLLAFGLSPHLTELRAPPVPWVERHDAWSFAYRDGGLFRWLATHNRAHRNKNRPRFELLKPTLFPSVVEATAPNDALRTRGADAALAAIDTTHVALSQLAVHDVEELHLEFHPAAGTKRFGVGFFDGRSEDSRVGNIVDLAVDDFNCGGLYSWPQRRCIQASLPVGEFAIRGGTWNDLRLTLFGGRVFAELNGWTLLDSVEIPLIAEQASIGFVAGGNAGTRVELRNVRIRRAEKREVHDVPPNGPAKSVDGHLVTTRDRVGLDDSAADLSAITENTSTSTHEPVPHHEAVQPPSASLETLSQNDIDLTSIEIAAIGEAWKKREQAFSRVDIRWVAGPESRYVPSRFRSAHRNGSNGTEDFPSRLVLSPSTIEYSTIWQHPLSEFWRASRYQEYQRELHARFTIPAEHAVNSLRLGLHCDAERRIDTLYDGTGLGLRRTIFQRPDVWCRRAAEMDDLFWRGPLVAFRPLARYGLNCQLAACQILAETSIVAGVRCMILEETRADQCKRRFWLDPQRDFLILRTRGELQEQVDLQYAQDLAGRWLPTSWSAIAKPMVTAVTREDQFPGMEWLFAVSSAQVVECAVTDSSVDAPLGHAPLNDELAPGAILFDQASNEWSRKSVAGRMEPVNAEEATELFSGKKPPESPVLDRNQTSPGRRSWRFYVGIGAGLVLALKFILIGLDVSKVEVNMSANNRSVSGNKSLPGSTNDSAVVARWIYRTSEGNFGPVETQDFLALVQNGTVRPQTPVRLSDSTQWIAASDIDGLEFPVIAPSASALDEPEADTLTKEQRVAHNREMQRLFAECVGRQRSNAPKPRRAPIRTPSVRFELPFKGFFSSVFSFVSDKSSSAMESSVSLTGRVTSFIVKAIWSRIVWLSLALLVLVALCSPKLQFTGVSQRQVLAHLKSTLAELKELRSKKADDATWKEFRQRYADKVSEYIPKLMNAKGETQIAPSLITVTRYLMPALLEDREGRELETQNRVESYLAKVDESFRRPVNLEEFFSWLMIVVDIVIVGAVFLYFGKGWVSRGFALR